MKETTKETETVKPNKTEKPKKPKKFYRKLNTKNERTFVRGEDRYMVVSFTMADILDCDIPVFKLKDWETGVYLHKTGIEIICEPEIAFNLSKRDLIQVSYFAGQSSTIFRNYTLH